MAAQQFARLCKAACLHLSCVRARSEAPAEAAKGAAQELATDLGVLLRHPVYVLTMLGATVWTGERTRFRCQDLGLRGTRATDMRQSQRSCLGCCTPIYGWAAAAYCRDADCAKYHCLTV